RRRLAEMVRGEPGAEVVGECANGRDAAEQIVALRPDVVLLDVQMPELDGFGVIERVGAARMPLVVFVTAYHEHAVRAFEVNAVDYLLKPFDAPRVRQALHRATERLAREREGAAQERMAALLAQWQRDQAPAAARTRFMVPDGSGFVMVDTGEIRWIAAEDHYLRLHLAEGSRLVRGTLSAAEEALDPARFLRIHRSTLVNLDHVARLRPWFAGDAIVTLRDGSELKLSRTYRQAFAERCGFRPG
ncbi:MAG TPA: LytTR family DNA-binding domain-containing protein, partial [Longimicrobium sp.]|nr:LytTR family DNA-binding domain-containing protein [Longimicrobium sp.]